MKSDVGEYMYLWRSEGCRRVFGFMAEFVFSRMRKKVDVCCLQVEKCRE